MAGPYDLGRELQPKFVYEDGPDAATRTLIPRGELDGAASANIRRLIDEALAAGKRRVIVDLSGVSYMETAALSALLDGNVRVTRFGAGLSVVIPPESRVRLLFSITRLDKILTLLDTREEAQDAA